jgi:hypothetical protein
MTHALLVFTLFAQTPAAVPPPADADQEVDARSGHAALSPEVIQKLSGDQLHEILMKKDHDPPAIAGLAVVGFFLSATLTVFGVLFAIYRVYRQRSETLRLMVEKGVQIPPELISPAPRPHQDFRRGLVLSMFGIGLGICLGTIAEHHGMWTLGLIPLLVGLGYIVASRVKHPVAA